jgi:cell volume regulation protein A
MSAMHATGVVLLIAAAAAAVLLACAQVARRLPLPSAALFLVLAAAVSNLMPGLRVRVPVDAVVQLAVVALVLILFDGGLKVGWHRFRTALLPAALLGIAGTAATAAAVALLSHFLLGFGWALAGLAGAALASTDPAVMFSVLRARPARGRVETALEAESGLNDPVAIALVIGVLAYTRGGSLTSIGREFALQLLVGAAAGSLVGVALPWLLRHAAFPSDGLYGIAALVAATLAYGLAAAAGGSGFLAVFVAGVLVGAEQTPRKAEVERFAEALASFAEMAVFAALGLTIDLGTLADRLIWLDGLVLALLVTLVARPLVVVPLTAPLAFTRSERLFLAWAGMKGAVPILLAALAALSGFESERMYGIVFVVVLFSVVVQGASVRLLVRKHLQPTAGNRPLRRRGHGRPIRSLHRLERRGRSTTSRSGTRTDATNGR